MPTVNPRILTWARETAGFSLEEAAEKLHLRDARGVSAVDRLSKLELGETAPTRRQLLNMSSQYHRPLLTFYMSAPPRQGDRGQDFRTLPEDYSVQANTFLDALIRDVSARQSMVRSVLEDEDESPFLSFVASMEISDGVSPVVASIRDALDAPIDLLREQPSPDHVFTLLRSRAESLGVFVLLKSDLGSYHTAIDVEVFRGFAISDNIAPFVVINDRDSRAAWTFTLLHELTHIWLGQTGVGGARAELPVEQFCNDVASEYLLPEDELSQISIFGPADAEEIELIVNEFANRRKLSNSMVAYRLFRTGEIEYDTWMQLNSRFRRYWLQSRAEQRRRSADQDGGPNYFVVRRHRIGPALIDFAQRAISEGALTTSKAAKVLGVKVTNVQALLTTGQPGTGRTT